MADFTELPFMKLAPTGTVAAAQRGMECWTAAVTQMAQGLVAAEMAHLDSTRVMLTEMTTDWASASPISNPRFAAVTWLEHSQARTATALANYRRVTDDLMANFFHSAKTFTEAMQPPEVAAKVAEPTPTPAAKPVRAAA